MHKQPTRPQTVKLVKVQTKISGNVRQQMKTIATQTLARPGYVVSQRHYRTTSNSRRVPDNLPGPPRDPGIPGGPQAPRKPGMPEYVNPPENTSEFWVHPGLRRCPRSARTRGPRINIIIPAIPEVPSIPGKTRVCKTLTHVFASKKPRRFDTW